MCLRNLLLDLPTSAFEITGGVENDFNTPDYMRRLSMFPTNAYAFKVCTTTVAHNKEFDTLVIKNTQNQLSYVYV